MRKFIISLIIVLSLSANVSVHADAATCNQLGEVAYQLVKSRNAGVSKSEVLTVMNQSLPREMHSAMREAIDAVWSVPRNTLTPSQARTLMTEGCY